MPHESVIKPALNVESYQDIAFEGAWKARSRALWATAAIGLVAGAAVGLIAPVFPLITGTGLKMALVAKSVAVFAAVGMTSGFAMGATIGNASGGPAAVAKEQEERLRLSAMGIAPEMALGAAKEQLTPFARLMQGLKGDVSTYFNPKVAALFGGLGAIGGLVMAAAFLAEPVVASVPALGMILGKAVDANAVAANATAITAYTVGVMGTFGALFGLNLPKLATEITHYTGDLLSGKALDNAPAVKLQKAPQMEIAASVEITRIDPAQTAIAPANFTKRRFQSYQELVITKPTEASQEGMFKS